MKQITIKNFHSYEVQKHREANGKEEPTTPEKTCPNKGKENCICSQCYMPTTPEKKCCFNCGIGSDGCIDKDCSCHQPIKEKWKIDFRKEFPSFLTDTHNGKIVPIYNGWLVFVQGDKRRNLPQDIEDFIENLLEQERILERIAEVSGLLKKRVCRRCGLAYQDPTYCSVYGRCADKHEWM